MKTISKHHLANKKKNQQYFEMTKLKKACYEKERNLREYEMQLPLGERQFLLREFGNMEKEFA